MSDPRIPRNRILTDPPRIPAIPPRERERAAPMSAHPDRDPQRPYMNNRASIASLARHLRSGLDMSKETSVVKTHELALVLDTMIGFGFGGAGAQQYQADLAVAHAAAVKAQEEAAAPKEVKEDQYG